MDIQSCLMSLGLTGNEATLYRTLSAHGDMTGYECAKLTGISRSNAYIALAGLCEKGAAYTIEGAAQRYAPTPLGELCANKRRELDATIDYVQAHMPPPAAPSSAYITINGADAIVNKLKNMLAACTQRLYLSTDTATLQGVAAELTAAIERGCKVTLLADTDFMLSGARHYPMKRPQGQLRLIVDSQFVLTGDLTANTPCSCLFSASDTLVTLFKEAMKHEIRLIELGEMG